MSGYERIKTDHVPIKAWIRGVPLEDEALKQLKNVASMAVVQPWVAAMPDVHVGIGACRRPARAHRWPPRRPGGEVQPHPGAHR